MNTAKPMNDLIPDYDVEKDGNLGSERVIDANATVFNRIISKNVHEYHFIIPNDKRVELGQIFSIEDEEITFLARVTDIQHDSNYAGKWDTTLKGKEFYDKDQYFNKIISESFGCVVLDEKTGKKKIKKSKTIPKKFSEVKDANQDELKFLADEMGDIEVGYLRSGSRKLEDVPVALDSKVMDHHMGVFATTGMGKSNFMKVFAASCIRLAARGESKFGLLIVDPHGEYLKGKGPVKGLAHLKKFREGFACYSTDKKNASDPGVEELAIGIEDIEPSDVELYFDWTVAQKDALEGIPRAFNRDWLSEIQTPEGMAKLLSENVAEKTAGKISQRIKNLLSRNGYVNNIRSSIPNILANLQEGKVVLVDIPKMSDRSELFLLSVLSRCILDAYKEDEKPGKKNCLITIEEAQRVLGAGSNTARFESIAREGRKFGVGLCAITQQPKLIDKQLLSQFNTLVVMGLGDRNDRQQLEESAKQDLSSMDIEIQTLERGEAIVSTLNIPFPVPARIHLYEDYLRRLDKEDKQNSLIARGGFKPFLE